MTTYFVTGNLSHDGKEYKRGDTIDLVELAAPALIEMGIISKVEPADVVAAPVAIVEEPKEAEVGGEPSTSGEPSIDQSDTKAADGDARDITPGITTSTKPAAPIVATSSTTPEPAPLNATSTSSEPVHDPSAGL